MEQLFELLNPVLAALIVGGTEAFKRLIPSISGQVASIIVGIVFIAIFYFVSDGVEVIEGIISFLTAVAGYDFIVKPIIDAFSRDTPPTGGGGIPPKG